MTWVRIDADLPWHDKVVSLPNDTARFAWIKCICAAKIRARSTFSSAALVEVLGSHAKAIPALVEAGLLDEDGDRLAVHDFDDYQRRAAHQDRQASYRQRSVTTASPERHQSVTPTSPTDHANVAIQDGTGQDTTGQRETPPTPHYDLNEDDPFDAYVLVTGRPPSGGGLDWINRMAFEHGEQRVASAIIDEWKKEQKVNTLLSRVEATVATARHHEDKSKPKPGYHDGSHGRTCVVCEPLWRDAAHV